MSSLKTIMVMGVLAAAGYWMYMGQKPDSTPADAQAFLSPPMVQIPGLNSPAPQLMGAASSGPTSAPAALLGGGSAPPFSANPSSTSAPSVSAPGSPVAGSASPAGAGSVTMLTPPGPTNIPNVSQGAAPAGTMPSLLSGTKTGQTPAATYPPPDAVTSPAAASPAPSSLDSNVQGKFAEFMQAVQKKLDEGRLSEAHLVLSSLYDNPDLPQAQARQLAEMLDQLAGTVIYSRQHFLEQPYIVRPGDTLDQIADKYNVPAILLARINGIRDPQNLPPGRELKVLRGPFSALVDLNKLELTLMLKGRYAGRFPIGVGTDHPRLEGTYIVREKKAAPAYESANGMAAHSDPRNPLGKFWIDLGSQIGIHGTNDPRSIGRSDNRGSICLADRDIEDVFGILSVGSRVVVQR
jgi:hypothetical protein